MFGKSCYNKNGQSQEELVKQLTVGLCRANLIKIKGLASKSHLNLSRASWSCVKSVRAR